MIRILLLEDEFELAMSYREQLEAEGFTVYHEINNESAEATLEDVPIDLVIADILRRDWDGSAMPVGGLTLINRMRSVLNSDIPVIAVTGTSPDLRLLQHAETLGVELTMEKPIAIDELVVEVRRLVKRYRSAMERSSTTPSPGKAGSMQDGPSPGE